MLFSTSAQWVQHTRVIAGDTQSDIVTLYLKHFHQSHSCMHIKEVCITGYIPIFTFIAKVG